MSRIEYVDFLVLGTKAAADITASYTDVITSLPAEPRQITIVSTLDQPVVLSFDGGVTDHLVVPASMTYTININFNSGDYFRNAGSALQVKEVGNPTTGNLYVSILKR